MDTGYPIHLYLELIHITKTNALPESNHRKLKLSLYVDFLDDNHRSDAKGVGPTAQIARSLSGATFSLKWVNFGHCPDEGQSDTIIKQKVKTALNILVFEK